MRSKRLWPFLLFTACATPNLASQRSLRHGAGQDEALSDSIFASSVPLPAPVSPHPAAIDPKDLIGAQRGPDLPWPSSDRQSLTPNVEQPSNVAISDTPAVASGTRKALASTRNKKAMIAEHARPIPGRELIAWHEMTPSGRATGITNSAPPHATIAAPCAGTIGYTGRFRSYGKIVILTCAQKHYFVLAGFGQINCTVGQRVLKREVLGYSPNREGHIFVQLLIGRKIADPRSYL